MDSKWYFVDNGSRQGPFEFEEILSLLKKKSIKTSDKIMRKDEEQWSVLSSHDDFSDFLLGGLVELNISDYDTGGKCFFIKVKPGKKEKAYGPYNLKTVTKLFNESRINQKSIIFAKGMKTWRILGGFDDFEAVFNQEANAVDDSDKRLFERKPIIARIFITDKEQLFEGICRDISEGGMQVLVADYPGSLGDEISINVHPENSDYHFVAAGKIIRFLDDNLGFSFEFDELNSEALKAIKKYLEEN